MINSKRVRSLTVLVAIGNGTIWKKYIDQLLVDKSSTFISDSDSLIPASSTNIGSENVYYVVT